MSRLDVAAARSIAVTRGECGIDAVRAEFFCCPRHQTLDAGDLAGHDVRDPARRVARPVALLKNGDFRVGLTVADLRDGGHAPGVAPDHHDALGHGPPSSATLRARG